jgi:uncharacterized SAM-binding protein YcdF (DUF218 family)
MVFILSKLITFLLSPFNLAVLLIAMAVILRWFISRRRTGRWEVFLPVPLSRRLLIVAAALLLVFSNPVLLRWTVMAWETEPMPLPLNDSLVKKVVVLGGMSSEHPASGRVRFGSSGDRLMQTLLLVQNNPVEHLVISGGSAAILTDERGEAAFLQEFLLAMGMDRDRIVVDSLSRNTYENAVNIRQIFDERGWAKEIVLVTSAWHLPRSQLVFEKQGFKILAIGADPLYPFSPTVPSDYFIPSSSVLSTWELLLKEWVGIGVYWTRGYL